MSSRYYTLTFTTRNNRIMIHGGIVEVVTSKFVLVYGAEDDQEKVVRT